MKKNFYIGLFVVACTANGALNAMEALTRKLFTAAASGNTAHVAELLQKGANPNAQNTNSETPLIVAIMGYNKAVTILTQQQKTIPKSLTNKYVVVISQLINHGANPNIPDAQGNLPGDLSQSPDINRLLPASM